MDKWQPQEYFWAPRSFASKTLAFSESLGKTGDGWKKKEGKRQGYEVTARSVLTNRTVPSSFFFCIKKALMCKTTT